MMSEKKHRVYLEVKYLLEIDTSADDEIKAIDEVDKYVQKADDYELVNRSSSRSLDITEVKVVYPEREQWPRETLKPKKK